MTFSTELAFAEDLDAQDELASFRDQFLIDDPELIYLDGNSLGRLPLAAGSTTSHLVREQWGSRLIRAWGDGWMSAPERLGGKIARLLGADPDEVIVADSTSVNLFKLALAAVLANPERSEITTDDLNFPSDLYILDSVTKLAPQPLLLRKVASDDGIHGPVNALALAISNNTALVSLSHTVFKSGFTYDMKQLTDLAHSAGALTLWDLSHSAGALPIDLHHAGADLAIGCTYKYLNGGPGAPAFLYVRRDLQENLRNPISGWMGRRDPFQFDLAYEPAAGVRRFLTGTPPVLSLSAVEPGVDMLLEAGIDRLRAKSVRQSDYLINLWRELLAPLGFTLNSPANSDQRGSHVSLGHEEGLRIDQALINEMKVLPDFRYPDNIRLGIAPLYTSFVDIHTAVHRIRQVVVERIYENYTADGIAVT